MSSPSQRAPTPGINAAGSKHVGQHFANVVGYGGNQARASQSIARLMPETDDSDGGTPYRRCSLLE
jgi:hypothetical protein